MVRHIQNVCFKLYLIKPITAFFEVVWVVAFLFVSCAIDYQKMNELFIFCCFRFYKHLCISKLAVMVPMDMTVLTNVDIVFIK